MPMYFYRDRQTTARPFTIASSKEGLNSKNGNVFESKRSPVPRIAQLQTGTITKTPSPTARLKAALKPVNAKSNSPSILSKLSPNVQTIISPSLRSAVQKAKQSEGKNSDFLFTRKKDRKDKAPGKTSTVATQGKGKENEVKGIAVEETEEVAAEEEEVEQLVAFDEVKKSKRGRPGKKKSRKSATFQESEGPSKNQTKRKMELNLKKRLLSLPTSHICCLKANMLRSQLK